MKASAVEHLGLHYMALWKWTLRMDAGWKGWKFLGVRFGGLEKTKYMVYSHSCWDLRHLCGFWHHCFWTTLRIKAGTGARWRPASHHCPVTDLTAQRRRLKHPDIESSLCGQISPSAFWKHLCVCVCVSDLFLSQCVGCKAVFICLPQTTYT